MSDGEIIGLAAAAIVAMALFYRIAYLAVKHAIEDSKVLRDIRDAAKAANRQPPAQSGSGTRPEREGERPAGADHPKRGE